MTIDVTRVNDICIVCDMDYYYCADKFLELIKMTGEIYIDGCGFNILSGAAVVISGLHDRLLEAINTDKQIIVTNLFWGTIPVTPVPVFAINFGGDDGIYCTASTLQIRVSPTDVVTVYNMAPEE